MNQSINQIKDSLQAGQPVMQIVSYEEKRVEGFLKKLCQQTLKNQNIYLWDSHNGLSGSEGKIPNSKDPTQALDAALKIMEPAFFIFKDLFSFFIPIIFSIAVKATENWIKTEAEKKEIENKNLESELQHLRYQLQPHFFFNSLNNIYSLVEVSPSKAQEAIHNLSKLMRYLLYDTTREKVELSDEINFLKKYIQLMEIRQTDKTKTIYVFPETENTSYRIAPLLFIPMIENAYKHGVSATQNSRISFGMTIKDNQLLFSSENSNFPKSTSDKSGSGIGLDNLKKRLELLYYDKYELRKGLRDNTFWITLRIELD